MIDLKKLIENGVQFGHQTWRWSPLMEDYIWGKRNGIHLINVLKTAIQLEKAAKFLQSLAENNEQILWVGTKRAAKGIIRESADRLGCPYVCNRWIGGTLTNYSQVKKSVSKLLHYEEVLDKTDQYSYTKKEFGVFQKLVERLENNVGGIRKLKWPVSAVVVVDARKESVAIREAVFAGIPVIGLVDTNSDPRGIDFVIPGNDDVARSIKVVIDELVAAVEAGMAKAEKNKKYLAAEQAKKAEEKKKPEAKKEMAKKPEAKKVVAKEAPKKTAPKKPAPKKVETKKVTAEAKTVTVEKKKTEKAVDKASVKKAVAKKVEKKASK